MNLEENFSILYDDFRNVSFTFYRGYQYCDTFLSGTVQKHTLNGAKLHRLQYSELDISNSCTFHFPKCILILIVFNFSMYTNENSHKISNETEFTLDFTHTFRIR